MQKGVENKTIKLHPAEKLKEILSITTNSKETTVIYCGFNDPKIFVFSLPRQKYLSKGLKSELVPIN